MSLSDRIGDLGVAGILAGALMPIGLAVMMSADTEGWSPTWIYMLATVGIFLLVAMMLLFIRGSQE